MRSRLHFINLISIFGLTSLWGRLIVQTSYDFDCKLCNGSLIVLTASVEKIKRYRYLLIFGHSALSNLLVLFAVYYKLIISDFLLSNW